jgi:hypothetical protein
MPVRDLASAPAPTQAPTGKPKRGGQRGSDNEVDDVDAGRDRASARHDGGDRHGSTRRGFWTPNKDGMLINPRPPPLCIALCIAALASTFGVSDLIL